MAVDRADSEEDLVEVWPENEAAVQLFIACQTQWRTVSTMAGVFYLGLDYVAARVVLDAEGAERGILADLRIMEAAALPLLNRED